MIRLCSRSNHLRRRLQYFTQVIIGIAGSWMFPRGGVRVCRRPGVSFQFQIQTILRLFTDIVKTSVLPTVLPHHFLRPRLRMTGCRLLTGFVVGRRITCDICRSLSASTFDEVFWVAALRWVGDWRMGRAKCLRVVSDRHVIWPVEQILIFVVVVIVLLLILLRLCFLVLRSAILKPNFNLYITPKQNYRFAFLY